MPWKPSSRWRHSRKARSAKQNRMAAHVANSVLEKTGDEGRAVRAANSVLKKRAAKRKKSRGSTRR